MPNKYQIHLSITFSDEWLTFVLKTYYMNTTTKKKKSWLWGSLTMFEFWHVIVLEMFNSTLTSVVKIWKNIEEYCVTWFSKQAIYRNNIPYGPTWSYFFFKLRSECIHFLIFKVGPDCIVGDGSKLAEKVSVKKSVVGQNCDIAEKVKIANSIIMDQVSMKEK